MQAQEIERVPDKPSLSPFPIPGNIHDLIIVPNQEGGGPPGSDDPDDDDPEDEEGDPAGDVVIDHGELESMINPLDTFYWDQDPSDPENEGD